LIWSRPIGFKSRQITKKNLYFLKALNLKLQDLHFPKYHNSISKFPDIYPSEYLEVFNIIYDQELTKQFLQLYHKDGVEPPDRFYADARYEFPEVEKRVRGIIVNVQQRAKHLSPRARQFLELVSSL
jgi:hypothetical protein